MQKERFQQNTNSYSLNAFTLRNQLKWERGEKRRREIGAGPIRTKKGWEEGGFLESRGEGPHPRRPSQAGGEPWAQRLFLSQALGDRSSGPGTWGRGGEALQVPRLGAPRGSDP